LDTADRDKLSLTYRPLTSEEKIRFKNVVQAGVFGFAFLWAVPVILGIMDLISSDFRSNGLFTFILPTSVFGGFSIIFAQIAIAARRDLMFGKVEVYRGFVTDKYLAGGRPTHFMVRLNGVLFGIDRLEYANLSLGDEVILEYTPNMPELIRVLKTGNTNPKYERNPNIPVVDDGAFLGQTFY
jgi:hypothetical protein